MAFQIQLPIVIRNGPEEIIELTVNTPLFSMNPEIDKILLIFQEVFQGLLDLKNINEELSYKRDFDAENVKQNILAKLDYGCLRPSPNAIILKSEINSNSDEEILYTAEMYKNEFALKDNNFFDIVADEAIYCRLIKCRKKWSIKLRTLLGSGIHFLDKFELVVDYHSMARVLDLLWVAVRIAINVYTNSKKMSFSEIMNGKNNTNICLKIILISKGNLYLATAGPLFASTAKSNYTTAIVHFLAIIATYSQLKEKLLYISFFKISHENHHYTCFGFDEALEIFSVKFIKQNVTGN
ncbi:hypothetical protein RclHR1_07760015 [Rhizophagus clarus]|uniref:Uncharacterized protein n=1 Tax=Rhizophagus clarus TaxID=94130 RepID=A0A2Z6SD56_9GLOM|nr:hypothetical protein RclHR1_07760015 [Rhizophagus clarus]